MKSQFLSTYELQKDRVFTKIKSRSAHMKSHRPPDAEPSKKQQQQQQREKDLLPPTSTTHDNSSVPSPFST
nr:unnamed protein product [Callosobruchus analis]